MSETLKQLLQSSKEGKSDSNNAQNDEDNYEVSERNIQIPLLRSMYLLLSMARGDSRLVSVSESKLSITSMR